MKPSVAIVTDSIAGITTDEAATLANLFVLPLGLCLPNGQTVPDTTAGLSDKKFYQAFQHHQIIKTSQTNPAVVINLWKRLSQQFTHIVHLGIGSSFSGQNQMLHVLSQQHATSSTKITVLDSQLLSYPLKLLVLRACAHFRHCNDVTKFIQLQRTFIANLQFYGVLTDVKFLQASGRIPPLIAKFLTTTKLIPVVSLQRGKIVPYKKKRTIKKALQLVIDKIHRQTSHIAILSCRSMPATFMPTVRQLVSKNNFEEVTWLPLERATFCHAGLETILFCGWKQNQDSNNGRGSKNRTRNT